MIIKDKTYEEMKGIMKYIGKIYKRAKKRVDVLHFNNCIEENWPVYDNDTQLIHLIDRTLLDCSNDTKNIIRHDYLQLSNPHWYESYYSRSSYYRLKKKAIEEFLGSLNI